MNGACEINALFRMLARKRMDSIFECTYIQGTVYTSPKFVESTAQRRRRRFLHLDDSEKSVRIYIIFIPPWLVINFVLKIVRASDALGKRQRWLMILSVDHDA